MTSNEIVQSVVNGLMLASVYSLLALGLTVVFGILHVVNFVQGHLLLIAAYLTYAIVDSGASYWLALPAAVAAVTMSGALLERVLFRRVRDVPINGLLLSIGLIGILDNVVHVTWGPDPHAIAPPLSRVFRVGDVTLPATRLLVVVATAAVLGGVAFLLRRTRAGKAVRATAQDREAAALMGIPIDRVNNTAYAAGAGLAAVAGGLLAAVFPVDPALGSGPLIKGFIVMIIGGAASPLGAVLGGLMLGMVEAFGTTAFSSVTADLLAFALLLTILYVRPTGLIRVAADRGL